MTAPLLQANDDYESRFQELRSVEAKRDGLVEVSFRAALSESYSCLCLSQEILAKLSTVTLQLENVTRERVDEVSVLKADLESEKVARRGWQDKAGTLRERLLEMVIYIICENILL